MNWLLEFLPEAFVDAEEATLYYEHQVPGLGARFGRELEMLCATVLRQPLVWRERRGGYRRVNMPGFPYYIAYFIRSNRVVVAAIGHGSRHPDYWKKRVIL